MATTNEQASAKPQGKWVTYRPDIKVLDCTIRDGGLMNNHRFNDQFVKAVYLACVDGGVDYMELGYKAAKGIFSPDQFGAWKYCDEEVLRRIVGENDSAVKLSVMADAERTDYRRDILPKKESVIDLVRVATYINQIPTALEMIKDAHDKGYETTINLMSVSTVLEHELDDALDVLSESEVDAIYVVDSFGALYSEQIRDLTVKFLSYTKGKGKEVGIHAHNNQQLAYANTVEALIMGASRLDASMAGLGRGGGNCQLELLIGFLHNPKFRIRPILKCIQDHVEPMRKDLRWGFEIPYMITGLFNQHPRTAIKFMEEGKGRNIVEFFDSMSEEE